jgi:hypothetical protein
VKIKPWSNNLRVGFNEACSSQVNSFVVPSKIKSADEDDEQPNEDTYVPGFRILFVRSPANSGSLGGAEGFDDCDGVADGL